ncbi:conserved hypothetical protein [Flavobacterium sp. 9AF]|uniref:archaemetzincin n=1 Tax=Flavobacterium sp. 9AF TaxID=2653142 RepID=UPI0012EFF78B|nr:archaemetzincin [Flavobacterium sp. 9AF]VXC14289.1 conserved hypothetical protein [Flavobacterium sp. 9AF]
MTNYKIKCLFYTILIMCRYILILFFICLLSCNDKNKEITYSYSTSLDKSIIQLIDNKELNSLDYKLPKPKPGDWLYTHKEKGQTFKQYCAQRMIIKPSNEKNKIYIQPIGEFSPWEKKIMDWNTEYIQLFFGLETVQLKPIDEVIIPKDRQRLHYGNHQLDASYIIHTLLPSRMPKDAVVIMGLTAQDLYPDPKWNYVFGLASYAKRTGVSSIFRYSNEDLDESNYTVCLRRIIKTSTHEISHMFSMAHCTHALCLMNGVNNLVEGDSRPNALCSVCLTKLSWNLKFNNNERMNRLIKFLKKHHLEIDATILKQQQIVLDK